MIGGRSSVHRVWNMLIWLYQKMFLRRRTREHFFISPEFLRIVANKLLDLGWILRLGIAASYLMMCIDWAFRLAFNQASAGGWSLSRLTSCVEEIESRLLAAAISRWAS